MTNTSPFRALLYILLPAIAAFSLMGCGSTKLTDHWQEPTFQRQAMKKVLVVGVTTNITNRILFERGFTDELNSRGIEAIPSYTVLGNSLPSKESVQSYLKRNNMPYVLVTRFGGKETTAEYVPPQVRTYYTGPYYPTMGANWDRYGDTTTLTQGAYVSTRSTIILTTSIYDTKTQQLVWTGRSDTFRPSAVSVDAAGLAKQIVKKIGD